MVRTLVMAVSSTVSATDPPAVVEDLGNPPRRARRPIGLDGPVSHRFVHGGERLLRQGFGGQRLVVHRPVRPVVSKPVANVHALLEMTPQWKREEGPARGDELHAGAEAPLHEGEVAARKMLEQL